LIVAVANETTTALIAASAALGGVIIGGLITAVTTALFDRRREKAALKQARRLVLEELRTIGRHAAELGEMASWPKEPPLETGYLPTREWDANRPALARYLDDKTWDDLSSFMESVRSARALVRFKVLEPIPDDRTERFEATRDRAAALYSSMNPGQHIGGVDGEQEDEAENEEGQ
jgi:hypothetical protein